MSTERKQGNRSESVRVRLVPDLMARFEGISTRYGMTPSTMAAFIIGQWVKTQEDQARMSQIALMDIARKMSVEVSPGEIAELVQSVLPGIASLTGMSPATHEQGALEGGGEKPAQQSE